MSKRSLNWGLICTARINRRLIPAIRGADRAELRAVASRSADRAREYADEWEIPVACDGYDALLADPEIDAVYIALPNSLHAQWAVRAARAGKHVLCEKPLALTVTECDQIIEASRSAGVVVQEAVMYLYHPMVEILRDLVRHGAVGELTLVRGSFTFTLDRPGDVRWKPELGGGSLWDLGSYPVSFIRSIAGEPRDAFGWQTETKGGVDEAFAGLLRFENGVTGAFDCGFRQQFRNQAEIVGTEGSITIKRPFLINSDTGVVLRRDYDEEDVVIPGDSAYQCEVEALTAAVLDGWPPPVSLTSSRANVAALAALYASARSGTPQAVISGRERDEQRS